MIRLFRGLGIAMCWTSFVNAIYHNVIVAYILVYLCDVGSLNCSQSKCAFLVADTQLYKSLCPSVRRSVGRSVHRSLSMSRKV